MELIAISCTKLIGIILASIILGFGFGYAWGHMDGEESVQEGKNENS